MRLLMLKKLEKLNDLYLDYIKYPIKEFFGNIKRACYYGFKLRKSQNYDAATIYDFLYIKLDRLDVFFNSSDSMSVTPKNTLKKLKTAKELAKRLSENEYFNNIYKNNHKLRNNSKILILSEKQENDEKAELFRLLNTYIPYWWD